MTLHTPHPRLGRPVLADTSFVSVTLRLSDSSSDVLVRHVRLLRDCVALAQQRWNFAIEAAAVLPSEMHMLCEFQDQEFAVGGALKLITASFARHLPESSNDLWANTSEVIEIATPVARLRRTFIEGAPVRAGLVKSASDWPFSSVHKAQGQGRELGADVA